MSMLFVRSIYQPSNYYLRFVIYQYVLKFAIPWGLDAISDWLAAGTDECFIANCRPKATK